MVIYVIGFIGSDRMAVARAASEQHGVPLYDLAAEIQERDGRTIRRMVITMGEHELRNKEYETLTAILRELGEPADPSEIAESVAECDHSAVICCTDDLILDPMSADLVRAGEVIIADDPATADNPATADDPATAGTPEATARLDTMFERAIALTPDDQSLHYAFLLDPDKAAAKEKFMKLYEQRRPLYESFRK